MRLRVYSTRMLAWATATILLSLSALAQAPDADTRAIETLIHAYATSIDLADTRLAEQIWSNSPEVSFIHPLGEDHGLAQIEAHVYRDLMGNTFSERELRAKDISIHVYGDAGWSEFHWDFVATSRKDHSTVHSQGRETQVYRREAGHWRIVHVHYSGQVVNGNPKGF